MFSVAYQKPQAGRLTARELIEAEGRTQGVYCGCAGYVSGHKRGTRGKKASFVHPKTGVTWNVYRCDSCGKYWKENADYFKPRTAEGAED